MVHLNGSHLRSLSLRARVFHPNTRIDVRLLGPCFKTGRLRPLRQHPSTKRGPRSQLVVLKVRSITLSEESHIPLPVFPPSEPMLAQSMASAPQQ
jgi:hypothetical protein